MAITYKQTGVDYNVLDPVKMMAQVAGLKTKDNILGSGFKEISESRGETAYIIEGPDCYYAVVEEGLGTKNLVADEMRKISGKTYYDAIAQDTIAMLVNDLITAGARPLTVLAYWAVGSSDWFADQERSEDLINGWKKTCDIIGVTWGGGETPTLKDIIYPYTIDLAGAAFGIIKPKEKLVLGDKLSAGDIIIFFESNGIHANGLTLARELAKKLPAGFASKLPSGEMYGEAILRPTLIYSKLIQDLLGNQIDIHYVVNITGHGWRKLMRAKESFSYIIENIPSISELFSFIQQHSGLSNKEMYATFNMGAGFAVYVSEKDVSKAIAIAKKHKIKAWVGGYLEKGEKQVYIKPKNIFYKAEDLKIR